MRLEPKAKLYHRAKYISDRGVSALCFPKPRAIDLRKALWTIVDASVTCPKCLKLMAAPPAVPTPEREL